MSAGELERVDRLFVAPALKGLFICGPELNSGQPGGGILTDLLQMGWR